MKPQSLYHGSKRKIQGEFLEPRQATDLGNKPDNIHTAVYATDRREEAIAMAILKSTIGPSTLEENNQGKIRAIYYGEPPKVKECFLYILPSETFEERPKNSHQWTSFESVRPNRVEKISIADHMHLVRKATDEERERFYEKFKGELSK